MKYVRTQNGNLVAIPDIKPVNSDLAKLLENKKNSLASNSKPKNKRKHT